MTRPNRFCKFATFAPRLGGEWSLIFWANPVTMEIIQLGAVVDYPLSYLDRRGINLSYQKIKYYKTKTGINANFYIFENRYNCFSNVANFS